MITTEQIQSAGQVPESFYNIKPGGAIFYAHEDGVSSSAKQLLLDLFDASKTRYEGFALDIQVETTSNRFLGNTIVAKRLNFGSLYRYNLLMARVNCKESVDAFVTEYFNLESRDDEALKFIDRWQDRPVECPDYGTSDFSSADMSFGMIIMRKPDEERNEKVKEEENIEKTAEQIADERDIVQRIITYADKYGMEIPKEILFPITDGKYILTDDNNDCKLIFTEKHDFWLKAGTSVKLELTKLQKALYLLLLAHPKGIEAKRLADYKNELTGYYYLVLKKGDLDAIEKTIDSLLETKDLGYRYKMAALDTLCSKLNSKLALCILNRTSQLPFKIQNTNGVLHIDLPRKFLDWQEKEVRFEIED